ncbi:MAG: alpha/beta hydrolase [Chloroflexi bacterium]|nr:alpha/beta hydrolase [Chloroflexota bacterium]MCC6894518.1 alpha/beta fold hydrolase [Anaerolineae bacterium]
MKPNPMRLIMLFLFLLIVSPLAAQEAVPLSTSGVDVEITASDGKTLYGSYFSAEGDAKAVILLHELYTNRSSWTPLVQPLLDAGFKVLAVDLRGYGKTKGKINWKTAQQDTVVWADWLKAQPGVQSVETVGSSMGANLALNGCAAISGCLGAVALSPGLNYFGVSTTDAVQAGFPALIVYADRDTYPKDDVPQMKVLGGDHIELLVYTGRTHGVGLFKDHEELAGTIVNWLAGR